MRGQMELLGMAFVVLLVSLGILLAVKFIVLRPDQNIAAEFGSRSIPSAFLDTLLQTTAVDCRGASFITLIQDCADGWPSGFIECGGPGSCVYLQSTLPGLLTQSLGEWGYAYAINVTAAGHTIYAEPGCFGQRSSSTYRVPRVAGEIRLDLC